MSSNGVVSAALGQDNKIAVLDVSNTTASMYYPQAFFGMGISTTAIGPAGINFDTCQYGPGPPVSGGGSPDYCGTYSGRWDPTTYPNGFARPEDTAGGFGGSIFVTESTAHRVSHVTIGDAGGRMIAGHFGSGPGTAAGQLNYPQYIARQPGTNYLYVTERDNRRISVFNYGGGYVASFGYGVLTGANQFEVCGIGYGPCRAGVAYQTNPKSYWGRLDFIGDQLYAHMPLTGQMQVFGVSEPAVALPAPIVKTEKVRLNASSTKVRKGKKVTFTAKLRDHNVAVCGSRKVSFQVQDGRSWDKLKTVKVDKKKCTAKIKRTVNKKRAYRAVLINSLNQATVATSPRVTVSLKKK